MMTDLGGVSRAAVVVCFLGMVVIGAAVEDAVAADRMVLGEFITADW